jgi:hypothetical protein
MEMNDQERINALTAAYVAMTNYVFNKQRSKWALFDLVMETKNAADDAYDQETKLEIQERIQQMPPPEIYDEDEDEE